MFSNPLDSPKDARRVLKAKPHGVVRGKKTTSTDKRIVQQAKVRSVIFPWMKAHQYWWDLTVLGAMFTVFFEPYQIAFQEPQDGFVAAAVEHIMTVLFSVDLVVNFNLAFYENEEIVFERKQIVQSYCRRMFWVDLLACFPITNLVLAATGQLGETTNTALLISLLRLLRLLRLHRMGPMSDILQYSSHVSLMWFTLLRNFAAALVVTHFAACTMYLLARLDDFSQDTWLGPLVDGMSITERYIASLYWSVVTFCTVGYGDFAPANQIEQAFGVLFMFFNILVTSWVIGSITLLVVKSDEKTGDYRDSLQVLNQYSTMHGFSKDLQKSLKTQLRLEHNNREISDEQVLKNFPSAVRRKILRKLYFPCLLKTSLMKGIRHQFIDAFLSACSVEIFSPGEEIVARGSVSSDLFLLVGGVAEVDNPDADVSFGESRPVHESHATRQLEEGEFIGEMGFFTESPQVHTVCCLTVCKTLTMSQSAYKLIAQDHPGSVGKILQNLLSKVEEMSLKVKLPTNLSILRAGSVFDVEHMNLLQSDDVEHLNLLKSDDYGSFQKQQKGVAASAEEDRIRHLEALTNVEELVKMHMSKQKDDHTTRFLFAASRGDVATISLMCDQGFDPDSADYDNRTALMVASMKGNTDVVKKILEYKADPNLTDVHGSTALFEAVKNGHENTIDLLLEHKADLSMDESLAASTVCQAVFDGNILFLKRLLKARIQVDASDYDKRTAAHIAAAEGNVAAIRILVEYGADLSLQDRWGVSPRDEAKKVKASLMTDYIESFSAGVDDYMPS